MRRSRINYAFQEFLIIILHMTFFKKAVTAAIPVLLLTIVFFLKLNSLENSNGALTETVFSNETITIKSRLFASLPELLAPYKTMDVFLSPVQESDFEFTSVGGSWEEIGSEGTHVEGQARFRIGNEWGQWIDLEEEEDLIVPGRKYAMASSNPAGAFQYRFFLYGDSNRVPLIKNSQWTFIKAADPTLLDEAGYKPVPKPKYSSNSAISGVTYLALNSNSGDVISRKEWGADESQRYVEDNNAPVKLVQLDPDFYSKYADELGYSRIVEADENGDKYKWPLQYPEKIEKIIIHHTATSGNLDNPSQAIRDIYHYHAVTRGWGDIGYNYIVDQQGKIYEGRYGGEGVIGAHSGPGNHGSIGIAFLGNYQDNDVPEDALVNTSQFIYKKAKIHGINPGGNSEFRGKDRPSIFGHRDIMSTTCPGEYLYGKIPVIRVLAGKNPALKEKFVKDYDYQDTSEIYYLELKPEEKRKITLKVQNIGKNSWNSQTYLKIEDTAEFDDILHLPGLEGSSLAKMQESSASSGGSATFNFTLRAGKKAGTVYLNIIPSMDGNKTVEDKIVIPVTVQQPVYKYEMLEKELPSGMMKAGESFEGWVKLQNNGNVSWESTGANAIFLRSNTLNIIADLQQKTVAPGKTGTFKFTFTAPGNAGYYKEIFRPEMADAKWITSEEVSFEVTVYEHEYDSELLSKTALKNWEQGNSYTLSVNLRNIGIKNWDRNDLKVTFVRAKDVKISELDLTPSVIEPGETGTLSFTVRLGKNAGLANNTLMVHPKISGNRISSRPVYFYYSVIEKVLQSNDDSSAAGEKIRVKIGFSGDPEITANGPFRVYAGKQLLTTLNSGDIAAVSRENGKYRIRAGDANFLKSEPPRLEPDSNAILKIKNYNHQPGWNQSLNDNEYRGILEVRDDDGSLIVINELAMEDYMKGLAEVSNDEQPEKIKAIVIAARTYSHYYVTIDSKFPDEAYDLGDNPDVSQKYLGYGFEKRAANISSAVESTKGKVITYNGKVVKTPYFSQSDGSRTKSAEAVWGWKNTPHLVSVDDSFCSGDRFLGHGVGLSGCGAKAMAEQGKNHEEILKHYYTGVEITDLY